jgi:hypothetical protein
VFGYIVPEKPELKIKEYELFRAFYCGLCKSMGKYHGQVARLTLNYDSTFFALLISCVFNEKLDIKKERCILHPFKKRIVLKNNKVIEYISDINILLAYYNLKDNWDDDNSVISVAGMVALKRACKRIEAKYAGMAEAIKKHLREINELEVEKCNSIDMAAEPFARLLGELLVYKPLLQSEEAEKIINWIGYNVGKWIYIVDAYDDIEKDLKTGAYNPVVLQYCYNKGENKGENACEFKNRVRDKISFILTYCLGQIAKTYELLEQRPYSGIIGNIVYLGMLKKTEQILYGKEMCNIEKSV